jgi:hypothetical protein
MLALALSVSLAAAPQKLDWKDFWEIAGVTRDDTREDIIRKWGEPKERTATRLVFEGGPWVDFLDMPATMLNFHNTDSRDFIDKHRSRQLDLLGLPCAEVVKRLAFAKKIDSYTTCKHYDRSGWVLDVTMMCTNRLNTLVVVWVPAPSLKTAAKLPPDHC